MEPNPNSFFQQSHTGMEVQSFLVLEKTPFAPWNGLLITPTATYVVIKDGKKRSFFHCQHPFATAPPLAGTRGRVSDNIDIIM